MQDNGPITSLFIGSFSSQVYLIMEEIFKTLQTLSAVFNIICSIFYYSKSSVGRYFLETDGTKSDHLNLRPFEPHGVKST